MKRNEFLVMIIAPFLALVHRGPKLSDAIRFRNKYYKMVAQNYYDMIKHMQEQLSKEEVQ